MTVVVVVVCGWLGLGLRLTAFVKISRETYVALSNRRRTIIVEHTVGIIVDGAVALVV